MCLPSKTHLSQMKLTTEQAAKLAELESKNKQAAREQLLRIQLILARSPIKR